MMRISKAVSIFFIFFMFYSCFSMKVDAKVKLNGSALESANYLCDNLREVNRIAQGELKSNRITSCNIQEIKIVEIDKDTIGAYIDFNDSNGYMTIGDNFIIYDFAFKGESIIEDGLKEDLVYNVLDGYSYQGMEINTIPHETEMTNDYTGYDGVSYDGTIDDLDAYVEDRYGSGYNIYDSRNADNSNGAEQMDLSVYIKINGDGTISSEGNCGLVSAYNLLLHYRYDHGYYYLPYGMTYRDYNPSEEESSLYNDKKSEGGYQIYDTEDYGIQREFSYLYIEARQESIDINGSPEGLTVWESRDILNNVMANHGYSTRFKIVEIWSMSTVTSRIDDGEAILWSTIGSAYGDHTMYVAGYDIYLKTSKFLFFTTRSYKDFLEIRDGWNPDARYYDFNGLNAGTIFGAFVVKK